MKFDGVLEMDDLTQMLAKRGLLEWGRVQRYIDEEVLRLCEPYVPRRQGSGILIKSGETATAIGGGVVEYNTPYARRWHYEPANFSGAPKRGNYWFDRMLNEGGRAKLLRGAAKIAGGEADE